MTLQEDRRSLFDRFTAVDVVRQVVGVGSVGMQVYLVLLEGRTGADPLFLQVKQAGSSVYEAHTGPSRHGNHGARVVNGKRLVQSATDIFVGWGSLQGRDYYVRQFRDMKIIPTTELIAPRLVEFAIACGETLARAHARTGDPVAIDGYIGKGPKFAAELGRFARKYADQNERDHAQLVSAIAAGTVESLPDSNKGLGPRLVQPDPHHLIERTVRDSPHLSVLSISLPPEIGQCRGPHRHGGRRRSGINTLSSLSPRAIGRTDFGVIVGTSGRGVPPAAHADARSRKTRPLTEHNHGSRTGPAGIRNPKTRPTHRIRATN